MIDFKALIPTLKALAGESRLGLISELWTKERHVGELVRRTGLGQSLVSHHMKVLREAGVVCSCRRGPFVYYRLTDTGRHTLSTLAAISNNTMSAEAADDADAQQAGG